MKKISVFIGLILLSNAVLHSQNTLSLDYCRSIALQHNANNKISEQRLLEAQDVRKAAFTQFFPNFNATAGYVYNSKNLSMLSKDALLPIGTKAKDGSFTVRLDQMVTNNMGIPIDVNGNMFDPRLNPEKIQFKDYALLPKEAMEFDIQNVFTLGIGFTQPIFMGGKIIEMYKMSKIAENMAQITLDETKTNLLIEVDEAYWRVVSLENKCKLAREYHQLLSKTYDNIVAMVDEGVATKSDALKVKVKLNEADITLSKAENGLALSKMLLAQVCGMESNTGFELQDSKLNEEVKLDIISDSLIKTSLYTRTETQLLDNAMELALATKRIAYSRFMPNIVGTANYIATSPNSYNGFEKSLNGMFSVGIALQMPIFHWGERIHTLNAAKRNVKILELQREEALEKMGLQVNQMEFKLREAIKQNIMANSNVVQAEENLQDAKLGYEAGVITLSDYLAAQTAFVSAKSEKIDSEINSVMTKTYLDKSLGKLSVADKEK